MRYSQVVIARRSWRRRAGAQPRAASVQVAFGSNASRLDIQGIALGRGGLSEETIRGNRMVEIRALRPRLIRLFLQEHFDLLPAHMQYHFETLDRSADLILKAGSQAVDGRRFKPKVLFPKIDQDIDEPNGWGEWEDLVYQVVRHY